MTGGFRRKKGNRPYTLVGDGLHYLIHESYFYKTDAYYTLLTKEHDGITTLPGSSDVLDAYIVPICLEKAKHAAIPACDWVISHQYVSLPAIIYGLNYFSTPTDYFVVTEQAEADRIIKHVTHHGKYPFCYQKIGNKTSIDRCVSILGKTVRPGDMSSLAGRIYEVFRMPLVEIVSTEDEDGHRLSSLGPVKYSRLSGEEAAMLQDLLDTGETGLG
jgi:hypothetical protein